jgi:hypothetical protein
MEKRNMDRIYLDKLLNCPIENRTHAQFNFLKDTEDVCWIVPIYDQT